MNPFHQTTRRRWGVAIALAIASGGASCAADPSVPDTTVVDAVPSRGMPDGKEWMTENLGLDTAESYCYGDAESNCARYGRLYSWESARRGCQALGDGWRLPTDDEWRQLASHFGGIFDDSPDDRGRPAYEALLLGGNSGFEALLGGGRAPDGQYDDLDAHGFYWTASERDPTIAVFYNFGRGSLGLYRQLEGEKEMAVAVRCVREVGPDLIAGEDGRGND